MDAVLSTVFGGRRTALGGNILNFTFVIGGSYSNHYAIGGSYRINEKGKRPYLEKEEIINATIQDAKNCFDRRDF